MNDRSSDNSELLQVLEQLRQRVAELSAILDNVQDAILIANDEAHYVQVNAAACELLGYTRDELLQMSVWDLTPAPNVELGRALWRDFIAAGQQAGEYAMRRKDGSLIETDYRAVANILPGVHLSAIRDISARKEVERALRKEKEQAQRYLDLAGVMFIALDSEGRITLANRRAERILGYSADELLGQDWFEMCVPPQIRDYVRLVFQKLMVGQIQAVDYVENPVLTKSGEERLIAWHNTVLYDDDGRIIGTLSSGEDITEQRQAEEKLLHSEQRYRTLFDSLSDAVFILDLNGRFLEVNQEACDRLGYTREEMLQMSPADIDAPEYAVLVPERIRRITKRGTVYFETVHIARDGRLIPTELSSQLIEYEGQTAVLTIARDISERRRLEEQFRQAQKMEAVGRLAGGVAHDFNNILTVIQGATEFLLDAVAETDPRRHDLELIRQSAERATGLVRQLLAFSRRQVMQPQVLSLNDLVRNLIKMLQRLIGEDIELAVHLADGLPPVEVDPGQMEQVIMNLAVNARDAMPRGGRLNLETSEVEVTGHLPCVCNKAQPGRYVVLSVRDTGGGMDHEVLSHLFEPFFTTKETGKGTGLGLSAVFGIVTQSGGHITVESEPGRGSIFNVYLPVSAQKAGDVALTQADRPERSVRGSATVLVVEDADAVRDLAARILQGRGYTALLAADGEAAERLCRSHPGPIHLLLTDVVMPGRLSGRELAERLRALRPELRVVYMSGYTDDLLASYGVSTESDFLHKPFTAGELLRHVHAALADEPGYSFPG